MILTVTLNPCIDHTAEVERLVPGGTNRVLSSRRDSSGKGVNVSTVLHELGAETLCLGVSREENTGLLESVLERQGIPYDFLRVPGSLRTNLKLLDRSCGVMTECNEKGSPLTEEQLTCFLALARRRLSGASLLVLSGSVPPGVPADFYQTLALAASESGVPVVLDASGPLLLEGLKAHPVLIKPNLDELRESFGVSVSGLPALAGACRSIVREYGVSYVCLSMGADGAMLVSADAAWYTPGSPVSVRGVQGAGDSMVAGLCLGLLNGDAPERLLRCAVAAAQGSLERPGTLLCTQKDFLRFLPQIPVKPLTF